MNFEESQKALENYEIGELKSIKPITEGFQSMNYKLITSKGKFVLRVFYDKPANVEHMMKVYDFLYNKKIKTPKLFKTKKGKFYLVLNKKTIAIQKFVEGKPDYSYKYLPLWGKELGKVQKKLCEFKSRKKDENCIELVKKLYKKNPIKNKFIEKEFSKWKKETKKIPLKKLTKCTIHSDCGPKDFFFKKGKFQAIMDFGAAHNDFVLYDIATFLMYTYSFPKKEHKKKDKFLNAYLKEFPLPQEELDYLPVFLKTRFLFQIIQHTQRYEKRITSGVEKAEDNLKGVKDGIKMLKDMN